MIHEIYKNFLWAEEATSLYNNNKKCNTLTKSKCMKYEVCLYKDVLRK